VQELRRTLTAFYCYASWFYQRLSANKRPIFNLYTAVALFNKKGRKLGEKPPSPPDSINISIGLEDQESPLMIPQQPLKIAYARLRNSADLSRELMHLIVRVHKATGMYYES